MKKGKMIRQILRNTLENIVENIQGNRNEKISKKDSGVQKAEALRRIAYDKRVRKRLLALVYLSLMMVNLVGCGNGKVDEEASIQEPRKKIVITTGFSKDEVFRIDRTSCRIPELMIYLTNTQNQYESVFGKEIWEKDLNGANLESSIKENVLARIAQIKAMNLLAEKQGVVLNEEECEKAASAAKEYVDSLTEEERVLLNANEELLCTMYEEYALANKVYDNIIKDINPEISDDEARTITVQQILLKTYTLNGKGEKEQVSEKEKETIYARAKEVEQKAKNGEDFSALMEAYSDDKVGTYSFGKGEMEPDFEKVTFNLGTDEVSDIIESSSGYHIVKCLSTFDKDETAANKIKIVEQRKKEVFNEEYDDFLGTLIRHLNTKVWDKITFIQEEQVTTRSLFDIYYKHFAESH